MAGAVPEQVLVLETVGGVNAFANAVRRIPGLDWLLDFDVDDIPPDDDFHRLTRIDAPLSGRVYLVMANQEGMRQLLRLWRRFREAPDDAEWVHGTTRWRDVFRLLRDIHPWGPEDRIRDTGLDADWSRHEEVGAHTISLELELWFRSSAADRERAETEVRRGVAEATGRVIGQTLIGEAGYHALTAELPLSEVGRMLGRVEGASRIVRSHHVVYIRPTGQAAPAPLESDLPTIRRDIEPPQEGEPIAAILDGLPLERHALLIGRLVVDDPDGWAGGYAPTARHHGTAMASLVALGDLRDAPQALRTPIYVRPILRPEARAGEVAERIPNGELAADLLHRAVVRVVGTSNTAGVAPSVRVFNHSIADPDRPFDHEISPWARVIDYLSWRYRLLFVASAGNVPRSITLSLPTGSLTGLATEEVQRAVLQAVVGETRHRRLLTPAESIHALTVGALHEDAFDGPLPAGLVNPYADALPSPAAAHGGGLHRAVKPDVLLPGGRQIYRIRLGNAHGQETLDFTGWTRSHGQEAAGPPRTAGQLDATTISRGTSNAAAIATRLAVRVLEQLPALRQQPGGNRLTSEYEALIARALIVHSASWDTLEPPFTNADRLGFLQRLSGYGVVRPDRVATAADERATMIGWGIISDGEANRFTIPLPSSLSGVREWRRVTITLAWFTPIAPAHRAYRQAALWFEPYGDGETVDGLASQLGLRRKWGDYLAPRRGTLQHEIFEGSSATAFAAGSAAAVQVNCRTDAGGRATRIPYALAVSIEVAPELRLPIYEEVEARVRAPIAVALR